MGFLFCGTHCRGNVNVSSCPVSSCLVLFCLYFVLSCLTVVVKWFYMYCLSYDNTGYCIYFILVIFHDIDTYQFFFFLLYNESFTLLIF